jgi:regulator of protease activity HflC (stomatin/prohibitin superfamily)
LNRPSVISIGTELLVNDPRLATTTLKDQVKDAIPIINNLIHTAVARLVTEPSPEGRKATADAITKAVNVELAKYGLRISSVEVTEAYSQPPASGLPTTEVMQ